MGSFSPKLADQLLAKIQASVEFEEPMTLSANEVYVLNRMIYILNNRNRRSLEGPYE